MKQKFPFVRVEIADLLTGDLERNYPVLLKRCSQAAAESQFVPWGMIMRFNKEAIELNDFHAACVLALEWWNCDPMPQKRQP